MTSSRLLPFVLLSVACAPEPIQNRPTLPAGQVLSRAPAEAPLPAGPEIRDQLMGYLVVSNGAKVASELAVGSQQPDVDLARMLGIDPDVAKVMDLKRPLAVAMLNPSLLATTTVRPYVAALPVTSRRAVLEVLAKRGNVTPTPWGAEWETQAGRVYVGFQHGYAYVAWRKDLVGPAARLLDPRLAEKQEAPVRLHLDLVNLTQTYGPQIEMIVGRFAMMAARGGSAGDPQLSYGLRQVRSLAPFLQSFSGLDLLADLDSGGLTLSIALDGKKGGAWADYVKQQRPGPAWGVRFLPKDAVLAYTTTASPMGRARDLDALVEYFAAASTAPADRDRWRDALEKAVEATGGELAYAVWPARGGGVGMGGAYRLSDPGGARDVINAAYQALAEPLGQVALRGLALDPARFSKRVTVRRSRAQIGGVEADLLEVSVKWPAGSDALKRSFEAMFGPKLVLATAFVGDEGLFALGADYAERLTTMVNVAKGEGAASLGDEPAFVEALSFRDQNRVSLAYLDTARMARFAANLMSQTRDLGPREQAAVAALLSEVGHGAIISTTNATGARYQLTTHLPPGAVAGAAQLHGALWRIALSPLLNPPMMPPMPVPPPHVTPTAPPTGSSL